MYKVNRKRQNKNKKSSKQKCFFHKNQGQNVFYSARFFGSRFPVRIPSSFYGGCLPAARFGFSDTGCVLQRKPVLTCVKSARSPGFLESVKSLVFGYMPPEGHACRI